MKKNIVILLTLILLSSCSDVFREFQSVTDMKWYKKDAKIFRVNISKEAKYDFIFAMRYPTGFPYNRIKVKITRVSENTEAVSKHAEFTVIDENNQYKGEVSGELWDLEEIFSENELLKPGKYTFKIEHDMNSDPVIAIIDIGLIVRKHTSEK